jgi:ATP-dependent exoDNAse (exonuclease V) alpha subunit
LPIELTAEQNIALVRDFVASHITAKGMVADWVYHDAPGNPHVHLMTTLRPLTEDGFGAKKVAVLAPDGKPLRNDSGKIVYELWAGSAEDFNAFRDGWFVCQNKHLALAGLDVRIDGRSYEKQGIDLSRRSISASAPRRLSEICRRRATDCAGTHRAAGGTPRENARRIQRRPEIVLEMITREKSVFDERDVAKILHRYVDDAGLFQSLMARVLQSPETLRLDRERIDLTTGIRAPAKYTSREMIRLEAEMVEPRVWLSGRTSHGVRETVLETTFTRHSRLSDEQRTAIARVAGSEQIAAIIGRAGAGKTTMMKARA